MALGMAGGGGDGGADQSFLSLDFRPFFTITPVTQVTAAERAGRARERAGERGAPIQ